MPAEDDDRPIFLSTLHAQRNDRRRALVVAIAGAAVFLAAAPLAKLPLAQVPAFVPMCESWVVILGLITAGLIFAQFSAVRRRSLCLLACGYLLTALAAAAHSFAVAGTQGAAWLEALRYAGFPVAVGAYALLKGDGRERPGGLGAGVLVLAAIVAVALVVGAFTLLAGNDALPEIGEDGGGTPALAVASGEWALCFAAIALLWLRRPHSVLDLWLMVAMGAWAGDLALSAGLSAGPYDLGFYAGGIYALLAASLVLVVLLRESGALYARLVQTRERESRERQKSIELAALNEEMEAFSYTVSHDLRAPLRVVDGYASMIDQDHGGQLDANARRLLKVLRASTRQMAQMIEDLLAFSRLGRKRPATQPVPLEELVRGVIAELRMACANRAIEFTVVDLGVAHADPALLKQAFTNLIGNSVKYTRGRYPARVEIGRRPPDSPAGAPVYYVKDNGTGFDMRQSHRLFGVFQRFHSQEEFEGSGVGLAIVERIVTRHGGRIWAESRPNEGAVFYFTLQPDRAAHAKPESAAA